jgi:opacity protein-like surface antigen
MRIVFFSAAIMASGLVAAASPVDGWYSSLFGGYSYVPDNISHSYYGWTRTHAAYSGGYNAGGRIGYKSTPMRYEAEFTYVRANLSHFHVMRIRQRGINGQFNAALGMANVYYDFPEMIPSIAPFLGVGLGYGWVQAELNSEAPFKTRFKRSDNVFTYQATAGLMYNFAENYSADLAYRYVGTGRAESLGKVVQINIASLGITYRFDQNSYK